MASCSSVLGFMFVIAGLVLSAVSYGTPFWVENKGGKQHYGLWQTCNESCTDLVGDHINIEDWFNIVRSLMSASLLLLVIDLFYTICYFTCNCCKAHKAIQFLALDLLFVVLASVVAILIFGIKSHDDTHMPVSFGGDIHFSWSLYVAIGSVAASLLALIFFICEIPNARRVAAYEPIRPTSAS